MVVGQHREVRRQRAEACDGRSGGLDDVALARVGGVRGPVADDRLHVDGAEVGGGERGCDGGHHVLRARRGVVGGDQGFRAPAGLLLGRCRVAPAEHHVTRRVDGEPVVAAGEQLHVDLLAGVRPAQRDGFGQVPVRGHDGHGRAGQAGHLDHAVVVGGQRYRAAQRGVHGDGGALQRSTGLVGDLEPDRDAVAAGRAQAAVAVVPADGVDHRSRRQHHDQGNGYPGPPVSTC